MNDAFVRGFEKAASLHEKNAFLAPAAMAGARALGAGMLSSGRAIYNTIAKPVGRWVMNNKVKTIGGALTAGSVVSDTKKSIGATMANKFPPAVGNTISF